MSTRNCFDFQMGKKTFSTATQAAIWDAGLSHDPLITGDRTAMQAKSEYMLLRYAPYSNVAVHKNQNTYDWCLYAVSMVSKKINIVDD